MHQDQRQVAVTQAQGREEQVAGHADDHHRDDHRGNQQAHDQRLAAKLATGQADGRQGAEAHRQHRRRRGDDQAVLQRTHPVGGHEEVLVPAQREALQRVDEEGAGVERQRHDHQHRQDQEQQHQAAENAQAVVPEALDG